MVEEESAEVTAPADDAALAPLPFLRQHAPWLCARELGVAIVGSQALAHACRVAGIPGPSPVDLDLAWALAPDAGAALLQQQGVFVPTTVGNRDRGTLALKVGGRRLEITSYRAANVDAPLRERLHADLAERDMTIGAIAVTLADEQVHDPQHGLDDWRRRRIAPVGDPAQRVREHAIRWLRYYRKAHELGFALDSAIRKLALPPSLLHDVPREAVALELRAMLTKCRSPGRCLLELHEARVLVELAPELARQFDGRPAGPQRWHPEVSQALHLVLALEWAAENTRHLDERDRLTVLVATLCHDLGKGDTPASEWPQHHGHEGAGVPHVATLLARWPSLTDQRGAMVARHVCELHAQLRQFGDLRPGTLASLYDRFFRPTDYPVELFALALAADVAGRLDCAGEGPPTAAQVAADVQWLRTVGGSVDARALRERHGDDLERFRSALHEARAQAIAAAWSQRPRAAT
jgi:tRNA nucleotidyltransferase (CCA-adding enzyme)